MCHEEILSFQWLAEFFKIEIRTNSWLRLSRVNCQHTSVYVSANSQQIINRFWKDSQWIVSILQWMYRQTLIRFSADSQQSLSRFSADSQEILRRFSEDSQQILSRFSADSQQFQILWPSYKSLTLLPNCICFPCYFSRNLRSVSVFKQIILTDFLVVVFSRNLRSV